MLIIYSMCGKEAFGIDRSNFYLAKDIILTAIFKNSTLKQKLLLQFFH